jgi:beta-xylosidase
MTETQLAETGSRDGAELWRDADAPVAARVDDLMHRMSLREKLAQLYSLWVGIDDAGQVAPHQHEFAASSSHWEDLAPYGLGQLTRPYGTSPVDPVSGARRLAAFQRRVMDEGRFGIPAMVHEECLTGFTAWQATIYPSPLCWGASFDPETIEQMGTRIGLSMRRLGVHQGLAPVLDVARDLRWGRVEETIAEDPYLVGLIGSAYVRGLEAAGVVSTLKHFVGYSTSRAGRNLAPVSIGPRELADILLPPFEMALRAGARSVMNAYVEIDGLPVAADASILTNLLRDNYGFSGTVVSDYFSVSFLHSLHAVADGPGEAAAKALAAGIDVELPTVDCFADALHAALEQGQVALELVDRAVRRVLAQKCELGLLDEGWCPEPPALDENFVELDERESRALAGELARRSIVLLANRGVLPLSRGQRIAVVGPLAAEASAMLGCYSFPMHVGSRHPEVAMGVHVPTVLEALREDAAAYEIRFEPGCPVLGGDDEGIEAAVEVARAADICLAVLGDKAGLFGNGTSGEGCDAADLRLPGRQEQLLERLLATGKPVVLVLLVGRPYDISRQVDRLAAAVCGFFLGEEGATALADVLAGRTDPSGRLPISFPGPGGIQPSTYLASTLARRSEVSSVDPTPVFAFGHGLSYAPATWVDVSVVGATDWATDGTSTISVRLRNDAAMTTTEVVQVYLHDRIAEVARPAQQLIAAKRVDLPPGEERAVVIRLHADLTSYTDSSGRRRVDPGDVEVRVGASSTDVRANLSLRLVGAIRYVGFDRALYPSIEITPVSEASRGGLQGEARPVVL